jgi:hypothetical protein|tara:strand:- start:272 stop:427 length:156 start_codon:yes stop_codon:yes gene_type:complete
LGGKEKGGNVWKPSVGSHQSHGGVSANNFIKQSAFNKIDQGAFPTLGGKSK